MGAHNPLDRDGASLVWRLLVLGISLVIAVISALPYAGGWNDGSRLATVECLVDYHTLAIDQSIFVQVPADADPARLPYPTNEPGVLANGTGDKLLIHGHYYSDKSPVPALLMASSYQAWKWFTGATARQRPDSFCYWMALTSSGLAYVIAVYCIYQLGGLLQLDLSLRLALTSSFGLATVALPYARHVNSHILLLAVASALFLRLAQFALDMQTSAVGSLKLAALGWLAGLGYTLDLGAGPVLLACTFAVVMFRRPQAISACAFASGALPWLVLHHAVNYSVGGTLGPANTVAEYFNWPGCTFDAQNMTGSWQHAGVVDFLVYAAALLLGKRGFLGHSLPLLLVPPALLVLSRRGRPERPEILSAGAWCGGTWLLYALTSNNSSGVCCSIRWFVPLLAPGYYVVAVFLREYAQFRWTFLILSGWGGLLATLMWWQGPWMKHMVPWYWPIQGAAFLSLAIWWKRRRRAQTPFATTAASYRLEPPEAA